MLPEHATLQEVAGQAGSLNLPGQHLGWCVQLCAPFSHNAAASVPDAADVCRPCTAPHAATFIRLCANLNPNAWWPMHTGAQLWAMRPA